MVGIVEKQRIYFAPLNTSGAVLLCASSAWSNAEIRAFNLFNSSAEISTVGTATGAVSVYSAIMVLIQWTQYQVPNTMNATTSAKAAMHVMQP